MRGVAENKDNSSYALRAVQYARNIFRTIALRRVVRALLNPGEAKQWQ